MINGIFGKKIIDKILIMKVFVFGSTGMLGKYISVYLKKYFEVIEISRSIIDISDVKEEELLIKLLNLEVKEKDVIINCAGTIKPRVDQLGDLNAIKVNSIFPRILANVCNKLNINLIHPTTDCVFSGKKGSYNEDDKYDVNDVYGMSKALGETNNCTMIRTSIIGEEVNQGRSLVEWIKSSKDKEVFGFTNHYWNGVTCLEFAKICKKIIEEDLFWNGTKHLYSNILNKKELVELISKIYELNITVVPKKTEILCDRSLTSKYDYSSKLVIKTLEEQIIEMKEFSKELYGSI